MTVEELIKQLKQMPQDAEVVVRCVEHSDKNHVNTIVGTDQKEDLVRILREV
jgi:predicted small metal-binding protein